MPTIGIGDGHRAQPPLQALIPPRGRDVTNSLSVGQILDQVQTVLAQPDALHQSPAEVRFAGRDEVRDVDGLRQTGVARFEPLHHLVEHRPACGRSCGERVPAEA